MIKALENKSKRDYIKLNDYKLFDYEIPNIFGFFNPK